jgi:uncharacterized membrane protein YfcA
MNLKTNSIHYQLYTFFDRNKDKNNSNICQYTRGVFAGILLSLFSIVIGIILSLLILDPIVSTLAYWITGISFISFFGTFDLLVAGFIVWTIIAIIFGIAGGAYLGSYLKDKAEHTDNLSVQKSLTTLGVFSEYIKSKHDKICRSVVFTKD